MSILNAYVSDNYGLIAVDTNAAAITTSGEVSRVKFEKSVVLGQLVVAARGNLAMLQYLADQIRSRDLSCIDAVMAKIEEVCDAALEAYEDHRIRYAADSELPEIAEGFEVLFGGWSDRFGAVVIAAADLAPDCCFSVERVPHSCVGPGVWDGDAIPDISRPDLMLGAMQEQVHAFEMLHPAAPIGGAAIMHEITPLGIRRLPAVSLDEAPQARP